MARCEVRLPELGVGQAAVAGIWLVRRGERVSEGQPLLEVTAAAAVVDLPAPVDGRLVARLVEEDEAVEVGQVLALIESDE